MLHKSIVPLLLVSALPLAPLPALAQDEEVGGDEASGEPDAGDVGDAPGDETAPADQQAGDGSPAGAGGDASDVTLTMQTWPTELTRRPITLARGMLEITGDILVNLSRDQVFKPFAIAPDVFYGVSDKLSVGLTHATGLCLTGEDNGCRAVYNDVGVDVIFAFMTGNLNVGAHGGLVIPNFKDDLLMGLNVGVLAKIMAGKLAVVADPRVYVGLTKRDFNPDELHVPVQVAFQATAQLAAFVETGLHAPFDGFGDFFTVPVGVGALFGISNQLDVGLRFTLPILAGGSALEAVDGFDSRALDLFVNFRL